MATKSFYSYSGWIIAERVVDRRDYLHDALGSITALTNGTGGVDIRLRYKPYGSRLSTTGAGPLPSNQWVGCRGYRASVNGELQYVRARHYSTARATWCSKDPARLNPAAPFTYCDNNPVRYFDPSGLYISAKIDCKGKSDWLDPSGKVVTDKAYIEAGLRRICDTDKARKDLLNTCLADDCPDDSPGTADCIEELCKGTKQVEIGCVGDFSWGDCSNPISSDCAYTLNSGKIILCGGSLPSKAESNPIGPCRDIECVLAHELLHTCKFEHDSTKRYINPVQACKCFNCIRHLFPRCNGYFTYKGRRYRREECDQIEDSC